MSLQSKKKLFVIIAVFAAIAVGRPVARADIVYRWDTGFSTERFNDSEGVETEDNWVANAFTVVDGGTRLLSIEYQSGAPFVDQPISAVIYQGFDDMDPSAGGGLVRLQTTDTTITSSIGSTFTIVLDTPVDMNVGDVFYAALLIRGVTGDLFPFYNDATIPLGHSFFDVGPEQGAPYDLDSTQNATVNGGTHPVVDSGVQSPGTTLLRVNATDTP
jgi:hypothetical protein